MTDRELLQAIQAQIAAHLAPAPVPVPTPTPTPAPAPVPAPAPMPVGRFFAEAQGQFSPGGNLDAHGGVTHTHVGVTVPLVWAGVVEVPVRVLALHLDQGSVFDAFSTAMLRGVSGAVRSGQTIFKKPIDKHLWEFTATLSFDVSACPSGAKGYLELDADFLHPAGRTEKTRIQVGVTIDNTEQTDPASLLPFAAAEWATVVPITDEAGRKIGERSLFGGYPAIRINNARVLPAMPSRPVSVVANVATATRPLSTVVLKNPDLHADPPNVGAVLLPESDPKGVKTQYILADPSLVSGDRIVARASDRVGPDGHGAVLCVVKAS